MVGPCSRVPEARLITRRASGQRDHVNTVAVHGLPHHDRPAFREYKSDPQNTRSQTLKHYSGIHVPARGAYRLDVHIICGTYWIHIHICDKARGYIYTHIYVFSSTGAIRNRHVRFQFPIVTRVDFSGGRVSAKQVEDWGRYSYRARARYV